MYPVGWLASKRNPTVDRITTAIAAITRAGINAGLC
jgi:hypothetical protein